MAQTVTPGAQLEENRRYLATLALQYPTVQSAATEIIHLQAMLGLPKGTEHFLSDLHGEYEAFEHILSNASGVIREKVDILFSSTLPAAERAALSTLIYYPLPKLDEVKRTTSDMNEWYRLTLRRLIAVCRLAASKYTRAKVRAAFPHGFEDILDELLHAGLEDENQESYYKNIIASIIELERADAFIEALCTAIKRLVVDRLHIVGDIFDRGPRADIILDALMQHHCVDIQWGNHDILWMGAAAGSRTCVANVLNNSITYSNLEVIEMGYGISLRPLALFAREIYGDVSVDRFLPKPLEKERYKPGDLLLTAQMHKAIAVILFKLEGQIILRNPGFHMDDRLLLDRIDYVRGTVHIGEAEYPLRDTDFPTINPADPYALSAEEDEVMQQLSAAFSNSEKLQRHARFLYSNGGLYKCVNGNLLFHGCIPMNEDGTLMEFECGRRLCGRAYLDYAEAMARQGYYARHGSPQRQFGKDFLWFLWCGRHSPLFGREKMATFERLLVEDQATWAEPKNAYYRYAESEETCVQLLEGFGLSGEHSHIINGHVPVRSKDGESPVKANGRLIVIDGGFCRAYQPQTGIAGYTLVYNSHGIRIISHEPFDSVQSAIRNNTDILSSSMVFETVRERILAGETDAGDEIRGRIDGLRMLLDAYRSGFLKETIQAD